MTIIISRPGSHARRAQGRAERADDADLLPVPCAGRVIIIMFNIIIIIIIIVVVVVEVVVVVVVVVIVSLLSLLL